jgi:AraC-like DNA-binding protein
VSAPVVPAVLGRPARAALRRALPRARVRVVVCRSAADVARVVRTRLTDAVIVDARAPGAVDTLARCRAAWPAVPRFVYTAFRPDDGALLRACLGPGGAIPLVEGVDDPVLADLVLPRTATAARLAALAAAPRLLRLTEPLQQRAWTEVLRRLGGRLRTSDVARVLRVSREHLSRQFGAGGAPNIKRVIDLVRTAAAADLLANPGYSVRAVARILGFASASHLAVAARRVAGVPASRLGGLGAAGVLHAVVRGRTRVRVAATPR